jgi:hypothetical protein
VRGGAACARRCISTTKLGCALASPRVVAVTATTETPARSVQGRDAERCMGRGNNGVHTGGVYPADIVTDTQPDNLPPTVRGNAHEEPPAHFDVAQPAHQLLR